MLSSGMIGEGSGWEKWLLKCSFRPGQGFSEPFCD